MTDSHSPHSPAPDELTLRLAGQTTDFGIITLDAEARIRTWNAGAERIFGYGAAEVAGQPGAIIFTEEDRASGRPEQEMARSAREGRAEDTRWHRRKDGSRVWVTGAMSAIRDDAGTLLGFGKIVRDASAARESAAERSRLQGETEAAQAQIALIVESISEAFYSVDEEFRFTFVNPVAERLLRRGRDELIGRELWAEFPGVLGTDSERMFRRVMAEREPVHYEVRSAVSDRWLDVNLYPQPGGGVLCLFRDASERRRQETERRARYDLQASAFSLSPTFVAILAGADHVFEMVNPAYYRLVAHREVIGLPVREALPELRGQGFYELLDQVYRTGEPYVGNEVAVQLQFAPNAPLEERYLNFVYQPMPGADGAPRGILVSGVDITEVVRARHAVEAALGETERISAQYDAERRRLLTVLEQSPLAIAIMEAPSGRMLFVNSQFGELMGHATALDTTDAYSAHYRGYHLDGREVASDEWPAARAVLHGETVEGELLEVERAGGHRITISANAAPVRDAEGRVIAGVVLFRDVTAERRTELQLRSAQRLQSVATLAGGVAHEVNNMMTAVLGYGGIVLRSLGQDHPQADDMRRVVEAGERAARVTQQLLTFTRQQVTQRRLLDLGAVTRAMAPVLRQLLGSDKDLIVEPAGTASPVDADRTQVEQVLINLVANARDATPAGGRVTITIEDTTLDERATDRHGFAVAPGRYVRLRVADTGSGMDEATRARIFEPFFTTKAFGQGSGLGLSMVYGIVKQHGGYVIAESGPGEGAVLSLYWPPASPATEAEPPAAPDAPVSGTADPRGATLWVIEDEASVRELMARTLRDAGYTVETASDGADARRLLDDATSAPALLIADLVMPAMNGRDVAAAVAERFAEVPVLFVSGYPGEDVLRRGLLPEGMAFLQKPFLPDRLLAVVEETIAGSSPPPDRGERARR